MFLVRQFRSLSLLCQRPNNEATSKPNASTIRELEKYVHKICTRGLEGNWIFNSTLPSPDSFQQSGRWCLRVGLGIFKNYSVIRSRGLVARSMQSKSEVEMRLQVSIFASPQFSIWASLKILVCQSPLSLSLLCQHPITLLVGWVDFAGPLFFNRNWEVTSVRIILWE